MRVPRPWAMPSGRLTVPGRGLALAAAALAVTAGCSSPASAPVKPKSAKATATMCGTTRTAANVPVNIQVKHGQVACRTALKVERAYAAAIIAGKAPGSGGGGPVHVNGWTCEGFTTPVVLQTGQASKCVRDGSEILAILPAPA
jgi:hypothetical protein